MIDTKDKQKKVRNPQKFFFDANNFDDDFEEEIIEEEPPPPVFSEEELSAAQQSSYTRGKQDGITETKTGIEQQVSNTLQKISQDMQALFSAETDRAALYEAEAVTLSRAIFEKLFPTLNEKHGLDEITHVIRSVIESQAEQPEIIIEVATDFVDSIEKKLEVVSNPLQGVAKVTVTGVPQLGPGDCRMRWKEGGARRSAVNTAEEIYKQLEHLLADRPTLHDNEKSEDLSGDSTENIENDAAPDPEDQNGENE